MQHPTADDIRSAMLKRAEAFTEASQKSWSSMGRDAVGDTKFFARIMAGSNFNVETYQRVMDWLDRAERDHKAGTAA